MNDKDRSNSGEQPADQQETRKDGVPEGMDPETGNYIRPAHLHTNAKSLPDLNAYKSDLERGFKECQKQQTLGVLTKSDLTRTWSRRLVSTMSNKSRREEEEEDDEVVENCIFGRQIRFTIMMLSTLCLSSILSNILTFNFTYICMVGHKPENSTRVERAESDLHRSYNPKLDYTSMERSILFMAVAVGALVAVFPLNIMLNKYGSRLVFGALGYLSAVATFFVPFCANLGFSYILIMRLIQGACFSTCLPVMGNWSTLKQNGIFIAILSSFLQIAPIFTMPVSGALCTSSLGWEAVYYLHGAVSIVLFTSFMLYHRNSPHKHPMMTRTEIFKVMFNKGGSIYSGAGVQPKKKSKKVPYRAMYTDRAIWAILVASFGNFMGTQLSLQFMPTYINKVLFLPVEQTGMASAISPVIMFFIKLLAGQSSDRIKIYNTLSMGMMGVLFIILALQNPRTNPTHCLITLIASTCILGFNSGGFFKSSQMVSRQHSHFTLANISFLNCVCMLLTPLLNELIAPENEPGDWSIVLWTHGIILLTTNLFFCFFASSKPAPWTDEKFDEDKEDRKWNIPGGKIAPVEQLSPINIAHQIHPEIIVEKVVES